MGAADPTPHIVLVEDNAGDVFLVRRALKTRALPCALTQIDDGEDAVRAFAGERELRRPDLILLDLNLPRCDGRQVLKVVRENPALSGIPVAVLTSSFDARDREEALRLGADRYVQKPCDLNDFLQAVGDLVSELLARQTP